jgi:hypothetical protein
VCIKCLFIKFLCIKTFMYGKKKKKKGQGREIERGGGENVHKNVTTNPNINLTTLIMIKSHNDKNNNIIVKFWFHYCY